MTERESLDDLIRRHAAGTDRALMPVEDRSLLADWDQQDAAFAALYGPAGEEPVPERFTALLRDAETSGPALARLRQIAAVLALLGIGLASGWAGAVWSMRTNQGASLVAQALRAHETYVVEVRHPVEVSASESDHLTAWLSKRVGQDLTPPNLSAQGFALLGGRVVPDPGGVAALLMYENGSGQRITLYVTREPDAGESAFRFASDGSVQSLWWTDEGLGCALSGDLDRELLKSLATAAYDQLI